MVAGHIKFSPDRFFGLLKLKLRKSEVDNLNNLVKVIESSTIGGFNQVQTVFDKNNNHIVHFYDWTKFLLKFFKQISNILKYYHFILHKDNIDNVEIKETVDGNKQTIDIRKSKNINIIGFSQEIHSTGLSAERQWYLYEQVCQHIQDPQKQNEYCPLPSIPKPKLKQVKKI